MLKFKLFIGILFCSMLTFGQTNKEIINDAASKSKSTSININLPETIQIKNLSDKQSSGFNSEKNMPWIAAFFIGIFSALINFYIAHAQKKSNERLLEKQLKNIIDTTQTEFKITIATKNRQEWITELRQELSGFLSYSSILSNSQLTNSIETTTDYLQKILSSKAKIELLTNTQKKEQEKLVSAIELVLDVLTKDQKDRKENDFRNARNNVIDAGREVFQIHWEKIKSLK
jgi:hypothetical protein